MRFEWDEDKSRRNLSKHDVRFETAVLVFDDPCALTQRDETSDEEERWITLGHRGWGGSGCGSHVVRERWRGNHPYYFVAGRYVAREEKL